MNYLTVGGLIALGLLLGGMGLTLWRVQVGKGDAELREARGDLAASLVSRTLDDRTAQLQRADASRGKLIQDLDASRAETDLWRKKAIDAWARVPGGVGTLAVEHGGMLPPNGPHPEADPAGGDGDEAVPADASTRAPTVPA